MFSSRINLVGCSSLIRIVTDKSKLNNAFAIYVKMYNFEGSFSIQCPQFISNWTLNKIFPINFQPEFKNNWEIYIWKKSQRDNIFISWRRIDVSVDKKYHQKDRVKGFKSGEHYMNRRSISFIELFDFFFELIERCCIYETVCWKSHSSTSLTRTFLFDLLTLLLDHTQNITNLRIIEPSSKSGYPLVHWRRKRFLRIENSTYIPIEIGLFRKPTSYICIWIQCT